MQQINVEVIPTGLIAYITQIHTITIQFQSIQSAMLEAQKSKVEIKALKLRHCKKIKDQVKAHATILIKKNSQLQTAEKNATDYHDMCFEMSHEIESSNKNSNTSTKSNQNLADPLQQFLEMLRELRKRRT